MRRLVLSTVAAGAGLLVLSLLALPFGHSPGNFLSVLIGGALGSPFALAGTLGKSVPLLLTGLCVAVAFRAGVWNIGAEGQFIVGAIAAYLFNPWGIFASLAAAMLAGAGWAAIAASLRIWRNAPEVLTTILLNFTAVHLLGWCVNGPLRERAAQYPQSDLVVSALPRVGTLHGGVLVALVASVATWWLLFRTAEGLRLRAAGYNASAARWAGINVHAQIFRAMALSGALAGLAGGLELLGTTLRLFERLAAGYGYAGIAVALLAQLQPLGAILSSLFFGALTTGAGELQRTTGISSAVAIFGQATIILTLILLGTFDARRGTREAVQ